MIVNYVANLSEVISHALSHLVAISPHREMTNALVSLRPIKYAPVKAT
jgi:hypothetical protein